MGQTILATLNELVQKLEDLDTQDELTALGDKIDALAGRISPDGQNVQQTLRTGLIGASGAYLGDLSNLSVLSAIRQQMQKCCDNFGSQDVPNDQLPPTQLTQKCINANYIFDTVLNIVTRLRDAHADGTLSTLLSGGIVYASVQLMGILVDGPLPFGDAITFFTGLAAALIAMNVNFSPIVTDLTAHKNTIICDLLGSRNRDDVIGAFEDHMPTCNTIEKGFFSVILFADLVNILYGQGYEIPDGYTPGYDCGGCSGSSGDDCPNREPSWHVGTPSLLDAAGHPIDGVTRSELTSDVQVWFELGGFYRVTVTSLHLEGAQEDNKLSVTALNCKDFEEEGSLVCQIDDVQVGDSIIGVQFTFSTWTSALDWFEIGLEFTPASESNAGCVSGGGQ